VMYQHTLQNRPMGCLQPRCLIVQTVAYKCFCDHTSAFLVLQRTVDIAQMREVSQPCVGDVRPRSHSAWMLIKFAA
jgi:hypothetical protein